MEKLINDFIEYLHNEKNTSGNTEVSYQRDLKKMAAYFEKQGIAHADEVTESDLKAYVSEMHSADFASSTISRNIASIRALFHYLFKKGVVSEDPSENLRAPRIEKKMPEILTVQEVDRLLSQPNPHTGKGIRDKAMMELLYATGMRVSDADGKISLNQQKPSKHAGLRRFGPEKFLQRNNEFMKERPIFYKKPIKTEKDFSTWLRCFYYTTKAVITEYIYFLGLN